MRYDGFRDKGSDKQETPKTLINQDFRRSFWRPREDLNLRPHA